MKTPGVMTRRRKTVQVFVKGSITKRMSAALERLLVNRPLIDDFLNQYLMSCKSKAMQDLESERSKTSEANAEMAVLEQSIGGNTHETKGKKGKPKKGKKNKGRK